MVTKTIGTYFVDYDEIDFDREGMAFRCPNCDAYVYASLFIQAGCHECDLEKTDVVLRAKDDG